MSSSLAFEGRAVAGAAVWMAVWWMTEAVPIPVTSLLPIVLFPLFGMGTMAEVASPYANSVVFLVMGGVILGLATEKAYLLENHDYDMQFGRWMLVGVPWAIVMLLIAWVVLTKLVFRAEVDRIPGGAEMIRGELAKLGPMTTPERRIALIFATAIFFWVAVPFIADIPAVADVAPWLGTIDDTQVAIAAAIAALARTVEANHAEGDPLEVFDLDMKMHRAIVAAGHPLADRKVVRLRDCAQYPIALPDESLLGKHLLESSIQAPTYGKALPVLNNP
mgnify:CR=1 FL=1